ncbi:MAG: YafY family transcriptional regulator [Gammaproteobacteria bacterium]|nr:YafY family transcriptional regulator [Gammaproteobacteria bacterium]
MRRADRLFQLVQYLRGRRLTTAAQLAERLEVSIRTIYRDIRDLSLAGVPIEGEAGVGYRLRHDYELPPLSFDAIELEALALGARLAQSWAGPQLARAAELALAKIAQAMPTDKRIAMERSPLFAPRFGEQGHDAMIDRLRAAIAERRVVSLRYRDEAGRITERRIHPVGLFFWGQVWCAGAWCELREDFRNFRLDRMQQADVGEARFEDREGRRLEDFLRAVRAD